jgi:ABC-type transporter Mla subunit MlaD
MLARRKRREILVRRAVVLTVAGLLALLGLMRCVSTVLARKRTIEVVFRDCQGLRVGSPVRVAGIDAGTVLDVKWTEVDGAYGARVTIALPTDLTETLRQDVQIAAEEGRDGLSRLRIVSPGRSRTALASGQVVRGWEPTPRESAVSIQAATASRSHDQQQQVLRALQAAATGLHETAERLRSVLEASERSARTATLQTGASAPQVQPLAAPAPVVLPATQTSGSPGPSRGTETAASPPAGSSDSLQCTAPPPAVPPHVFSLRPVTWIWLSCLPRAESAPVTTLTTISGNDLVLEHLDAPAERPAAADPPAQAPSRPGAALPRRFV